MVDGFCGSPAPVRDSLAADTAPGIAAGRRSSARRRLSSTAFTTTATNRLTGTIPSSPPASCANKDTAPVALAQSPDVVVARVTLCGGALLFSPFPGDEARVPSPQQSPSAAFFSLLPHAALPPAGRAQRGSRSAQSQQRHSPDDGGALL